MAYAKDGTYAKKISHNSLLYEPIVKRYISRPHCSSDACVPKHGTRGWRVGEFTPKHNAKRDDVFCPDCGHALKFMRAER